MAQEGININMLNLKELQLDVRTRMQELYDSINTHQHTIKSREIDWEYIREEEEYQCLYNADTDVILDLSYDPYDHNVTVSLGIVDDIAEYSSITLIPPETDKLNDWCTDIYRKFNKEVGALYE